MVSWHLNGSYFIAFSHQRKFKAGVMPNFSCKQILTVNGATTPKGFFGEDFVSYSTHSQLMFSGSLILEST